MSEPVFKFKQFSVRHRDSAMKVGIDGVLLGAWAEAENPKQILDIGTGTGLIALMLAQRFPDAGITGVEIENTAFEEAEFNFENSPFADRCTAVHSSIQDFETERKFDLIVSNPPYFRPTHSDGTARSKARQQSELSFGDLLKICGRLLNPNGNCAFIIPFDAENAFIQIAAACGLFPKKITRVRGNPNVAVKRSLLLFSENKSKAKVNELLTEDSRNVYTEDYIRLTRDFYLKM